MAIKISACYITKNEENNLARSLSRLRGQVDEIVVVDTGSTDATIKIALNYGATVYQYEWRDDFSAARNFALTKAKGDWIIFLDADEYFSLASAKKIRSSIAKAKKDAMAVTLLNIETKTVKREASSVVLRLWENKPQRRYKNKIHECLCEADENICNVQVCPELILYHTGYSNARMLKKTERNLRLLLKEQAAGQGTPFFPRYLAQSYYMLQDYEKALPYVLQAIQQEPPTLDSKVELYRVACVCMRKLNTPLTVRKEILESIIVRSNPETAQNASGADVKEKWLLLLQWSWEIGAMRAYICAAIVLARDYQYKSDEVANILLWLQNKSKKQAKIYLKNMFDNAEKNNRQGKKINDLWQMLTSSTNDDAINTERWQLMLEELAIRD